MPEERRPHWWSAPVKAILLAVIIFFIAKTLLANWRQVRTFPWRFNIPLLLSATVLQYSVLLYLIEVWRRVLAYFGGRLSFRAAYRIWVVANLGKYLPGKVWSVVGLATLAQRAGVTAELTVAVAMLTSALTVLGAFVVVFLFSGTSHFAGIPPSVYFVFVSICLVAVYPRWLFRLLNLALGFLKRDPIRLAVPPGLPFVLLIFYLVAWVLYGGSFFLFLRALGLGTWHQFFPITAAFIFSYLIGFLALFVPGGLGVREGLLTLSLSAYLPAGVATAVAIGSRLWMTAIELLALLGIRRAR